jgi:hypothetical protein
MDRAVLMLLYQDGDAVNRGVDLAVAAAIEAVAVGVG